MAGDWVLEPGREGCSARHVRDHCCQHLCAMGTESLHTLDSHEGKREAPKSHG